MRGIVLLSVGNPYYIRMAYQLAFSIKCSEKTPICLLTDNVHFLDDEQKKVFDEIKEIKVKRGQELRTKTAIYRHSPFKETIYLDVDMLSLNIHKFEDLFSELSDVDFTMATRGSTPASEWDKKTSMWGNLEEYKEKYPEGKWCQLSSEFIYFKKKDRVRKLFDDANKMYDKITNYKKFGLGMADEFAFGLSCCKNNLYPHKETFTPIYWAHAEKRPMREIDPYINDRYYGYSMGGKTAHPQQTAYYMNMLKWYQQNNGRIKIFIPKSKNYYISERHTI